MEAAERLSLSAFNDALLEELLPACTGAQTVLLDCDDHTLAAATARLDATAPPDATLREALHSVAPISTGRGLRGVLRALTGPPDDLIVLCACVLAASRMHPDEKHSTAAYYARLCEVLGIEPREQWPAVAGFEEIPGRFDALARWAAREGRGTLALPADPWPALVGVPISQTLLRRVDRDRLGWLFDRHRVALDLGRDPLRLLRFSAVRHVLTTPAQRLLHNGELDQPLRAALRAAYESWDGTVLDERGRRLAAGRLRLGLAPGRMTLNLSLPKLAADVELTGPDAQNATLPAWPGELTLPIEWLAYAAEGSVAADAADGRLIRALPGRTMLFDVADDGFWLTATATEGRSVIVLTCAAELVSGEWGRRLANVPLPDGWVLICDVNADELPEELREPVRDEEEGEAEIGLVGGLPLERGVWLIDHPPVLHSELDEPVLVEARSNVREWRELGEISNEEPFPLEALTHELGTHHVAVGGYEFVIELAARGPRTGIGELAHRPRNPYLMRAGAISDEDARLYGDPRPVVCGATMDGAGKPGWRPPVTVRAQATVHVVYRDGHVLLAAPRPQPQWARQAQLPPGGSWVIPNGEAAVWLCVQSRTHPRVVALASERVPLTDEVLDLARWFSEQFPDAPVIDRAGDDGEARWRELVNAASIEDEELPSHG